VPQQQALPSAVGELRALLAKRELELGAIRARLAEAERTERHLGSVAMYASLQGGDAVQQAQDAFNGFESGIRASIAFTDYEDEYNKNAYNHKGVTM
jgi:hypothetical protein